MPSKFKPRFYLLPTLLLVSFLVAITLVTVTIAMARFESMAEESARNVFSLIAQRNADQLGEMVRGAGGAVQAQAGLPPEDLDVHDEVRRARLESMLLTAVRAHPFSYSYYFGFGNDEFLQVIGVRRNPRLIQALGAPQDTYFAVRFTALDAAAGQRRETWRFLAQSGQTLGQAERAAEYAPSTRPWYAAAQASAGLKVTDPYVYESLQELGLTLSQALPGGIGVAGADMALGGLGDYAAASMEGREGGIVVTDHAGRVLATHASQHFAEAAQAPMQGLGGLANPFLAAAAELLAADGSRIEEVRGEKLAYASRSVEAAPGRALHVVAYAPMSAYAGPIHSARNDILLACLVLIGVFLPLAIVASRRVAGTLDALTVESERIQRLDFSGDQPVRSMFYELDALGRAQSTMKCALRERTRALDAALARLGSLVESGLSLSAHRAEEEVLRQALESAGRLLGAQGGQFWLASGPGAMQLAAEHGRCIGAEDVVLGGSADPCEWVAEHRAPLLRETLRDGVPVLLMAVPVLAGDQLLGALVLEGPVPARRPAEGGEDVVRYAQTLAAQAGIALENMALLRSQRELMESLIRLIAGAIDAKSIHAGSRCARVPELAQMLAEEASRVEQGPLADFRFETEDQWREFRMGAWLHDCGKLTTPDYVLDKTAKLETVYNRIHEIRMRFEVLLRDAQIERLKALVAGGDAQASLEAFEARWARLREDFAFVAACNNAAGPLAPGYRDRLEAIGRQTWLRHFDDRLGLSLTERQRLARMPAPTLPVVEPLLADKPEHMVPRTDAQRPDPRYGFSMDEPAHLQHLGELYNLMVEQGVLTPEEQYQVNAYVMQTIVMLDQLPLPDNLRRVPEYAGTHHETLSGSGYPRGLSGEELSVPSRIMAIADAFESLTAADPLQGAPRKLSDAVRELARLKHEKAIDAGLFDLFLNSGVYLAYARRYLEPEQIDEVDIQSYLG